MKIFLFHFFSPTPTPDYQLFYNYFVNKGHEVWLSNMTENGRLVIENGAHKQVSDSFPWKLRKQKRFNFIAKRIAFLIFVLRIRRLVKQVEPDFFVITPCELMYVGLIPLFMPKKIKFIHDLRQLGLSAGHTWKPRINNIRTKYRIRFLSRYVFDRSCFAYREAAVHVLGEEFLKHNGAVMEVGVDNRFMDCKRSVSADHTGKLEMVYIGALARVRKLEFIFEAIHSLKNSTRNFRLTFIGHDEDGHYHRLLEKSGLSEYITILDPVPYFQVPETLTRYDVAIAYIPDHPDWKYQPTLKVREYVALGIPVLGSENGPNRDFIAENVNGFLFKNEVDDFCRVALKLTGNKALLREVTENAINGRRGFTWNEAARNYELMFEQLLNKTK